MSMPMPPPDTRAAGQAGHIADHNTISDALGWLGSAVGALQVQQAASPVLVPAVVQSASFTAGGGGYYPVSISGGPVTATLPGAPADGTRIGFKVISTAPASQYALTVTASGADRFNSPSGVASITLVLPGQGVILQYSGLSAVWYVTSDVLPYSSVQQVIPGWVSVRLYGAKGDGVTDDTAAIQAALNAVPAGGGVVYLPAGTYKTTSTLSVTVPRTIVQGDGRRATTIAYYGTGDCVYMHATSYAAFSAFTFQCGGIKGLAIDGTHAPFATSGLNFGDWYDCEFDLEVNQFTAVGSYGVRFFNSMGFTEKTRAFFAISHCDTCLGFDVSTSTSTANRSFGYSDITVEMDGMTGNGIKLTNGAMVYHSRLAARANVQAGAGSGYACMLITGKTAAGVQNPGSASQIAASRLDFQAEANSATSVQSTLLLDLSNNARVYNCTGVLDFSFGSQMALANITQQSAGNTYFQYAGVVTGDTNLNPGGQLSGFITAAPRLYGRGQFTSAGVVYTELGDMFSLTLSQSVTINLIGAGGSTIAGPQRKTIVITQAASGGPYTVTWPHNGSPSLTSPSVIWAGGTAPTMSAGAGAVDKYELSTIDGKTWYGTAAQNMS